MLAATRHNRSAEGDRAPLHVMFAGGGTGGHLFPAIALAQELQQRDPETLILFVSTGRPFEQTTLARYGFALSVIPAEGIKGKSVKVALRAGVKAIGGVIRAWKLVRGFRPDLVVSVGSYAAGPVGLASWLARVPLVLQEQNSVPGITHRLLKYVARRVYVTFPASQRWFPTAKVRLFGNPLRRELLGEKKDDGQMVKTAQGSKSFTVLILGGSQGAHAINRAVVEALSDDCREMEWIHQTGAADETWVREVYETKNINADVRSFFTDLAESYQRADLVVCRAGATTITELTALGKPAIFIPFPFAADDHQTQNALELCNQGAAEFIMEEDLSGTRLAARIFHHRDHPEELARMGRRSAGLGRPHAARDMVDDWYRLLMQPPLAA